MRTRSFVWLLLLVATGSRAAEGMWTFDNPPIVRMQQELGWSPDPAWLEHAMRGSARFGNGCSSSFISKDGLVLTNHHCAVACVEQLSTPTNDLMKTGFLARRREDERRCPALDVSRLERISDVTAEVTKAGEGLSGNAFQDAQNAAKARLTSACAAGDARYRCDVVSLYHGGQYKLYRYRRYDDARLVFVPEQAISFFGGDPDNFNFPRYDLDMAIVRVYENGAPAAIVDWFQVDGAGPAANEPVFTVGHPGNTDREYTVAQLERLRSQVLYRALVRQSEYRGVVEQYRTRGTEEARVANAALFSTENYIKVLDGEMQALFDEDLFARKRRDEAALRAYVAAHPQLADASGAWDAITGAQARARDLFEPYVELEAGGAFDAVYWRFARTIVRGAAERAKPNAERLPEFNDNQLPRVEARLFSEAPIYPDFEKVQLVFSLTRFRADLGADAPVVRRTLGRKSPQQMASDLVDGTRLGDVAERRRLWEGGAAAVAASDDPFIRLAVAIDPEARALRSRYEREVTSVVTAATEKIAKARFAMLGDSVYPDATFTLRLSYGRVEGWTEAGQPVPPFTNFGGAFDRATGAEPFALPASWLAARSRIDERTPFNFSSTNDIVGGNSGSPVLNRRGALVGLVFDGNIHSLGGSYYFDGTLNRTVAVDSAAILAALRTIYGADELVRELSGN